MPSRADQYTRYFYHCFPRWACSTAPGVAPPAEAALRIIRLMFKWGLLLTPEEIVFRGEPFKDKERGQPVRILQRRLCLTELAEDALPDHAQVFGPVALEFDQPTLRRIGAMPVVYIPQSLSADPEGDHFAIVGQTMVYRLRDTYGLLSHLAQLDEHLRGLPPGDAAVRLRRSASDPGRPYPAELLRDLLETLTHGRPPLPQLSAAMSTLSCFFYPTDAPTPRGGGRDDARLAYYREREWRIVSGLHFAGTPLDERLSPEAERDVASVLDPSLCPEGAAAADGLSFARDCNLVRGFGGESIMNSVRRIIAPAELLPELKKLARESGYRGIVTGYPATT